MEEVIKQLLAEVRDDYAAKKSLSSGVLKALWAVFQNPLMGALDIIDRRGVTKATCPSQRTIYIILGTSKKQYSCLSSGVYCSCPAFEYLILKKEEYIMCKHVLAARIADAMNLCEEIHWSDQRVTSAMNSM